MTKSASLTASETFATLNPAFSALDHDEEPSRNATVTSTPDSCRLFA